MAKRTSISPVGLSLIKAFEGFRPEATQLPNGIWVIGHGHTKTARKGAKVSRNDAEDLLMWDLSQLEPQIRDVIFAPLSGPQMDALLSLAFNIGFDSFRKCDVVRFLNQGDPISAAAAFDVWKKAKFHEHVIVVDALVRRRAAEKARFLKVDAGSLSLPTGRLQPLADGELAADIDTQAKARTETRDGDVVIDLGESAALSGLMGEQLNVEDGTMVTFGEGEPPHPEYHFSDTDPDDEAEAETVSETVAEAEAAAEAEPEAMIDEESVAATEPETEAQAAEEKPTTKVTPGITAAMAEEGMVPVGEALERKSTSLKEVAESISGRLDKVAVPVSAEETVQELAADTNETDTETNTETLDEAAQDEPEVLAEPPLEADMTPPMEAEEWDGEEPAASGEMEISEEELPPLPENGVDGEEQLTPEMISREVLAEQDREYDALTKRNLGMFSMMGILGVIFTAGGIFELRRSGQVITYWDMVKGPGMAALGLLLILAAVYYLVRRLGK